MASRQYRAAVQQVRSRLLKFGDLLWDSLPGYSDSDLDYLVKQLTPRVQAGQIQIATLTSADIAQRLGVKPKMVDRDAMAAVRNVPDKELYGRPIVTVRTKLSQGATAAAAMDAGRNRMSSLISTGLQMAKVRQADTSLQSGGVTSYKRVLSGSENCALCVIASTQRYHVGNLMPIHPGCVPGDSTVSIPAGDRGSAGTFAWRELQAVSRRLFKGELVEFVTASGDRVRVTPNHPVLTGKGWLPAHLLSKGDAVFRSGSRERVIGGGPDVHQGPVLAQDVFDAARMTFPLVCVPLATEDFHADGADGEVEIVYTDGNLPAKRNIEFDEEIGEHAFMNAHGGRLAFDARSTFGAFVPGGLAAAGRGMGGSGLIGDLFGSHLGDAQRGGRGSSARFDAPAQEFSLDNAATYASQGLNLKSRLSGLVQSDSIVELRRIGFRGHVYNLHTSEGWYSTNNHVVSNCNCDVEELTSSRELPQVIEPDLLENAHGRIKEVTGIADRGGRAPDYRKLLLVHEHGEIGPVLTWRGQKFTSLADLPKG